MKDILEMFRGSPGQTAVAKIMLTHGMKVVDNIAYCGDIEIKDSALARAAGVDRRVVRMTIEKISSSEELSKIFSNLRSMTILSDVASEIGCSVVEIIPTDEKMPGILAGIMKTVSESGISIRQAVVLDPAFGSDEPKLILIFDGELPPEYLAAIKTCRGVDRVIIR